MKKVISAAMAAAMAAAAVPAALAVEFSDVNEVHWAYEYINSMADMGVIEGYDDGSFMPEKVVTRAEFAKMLSGAARLSVQADDEYIDVNESDWYADYVGLASPYLVGDGNTYNPQEGASRKDVAAAIVRLCGYDLPSTDVAALEAKFSDVTELPIDAEQYIAAAVEHGLMDGFDEGVFKPYDCITRAQAAAILGRTFDATVVIRVGDENIYNTDFVNFAIDLFNTEDPEYKMDLANDLKNIFAGAQIAKSQGIELDDNDRNYIADNIGDFAEYGAKSSPEFLERVYTAIVYEKKLLNKYAEAIEVSDEEIEKTFAENYYRAKHILVADEALANDLLKKAVSGKDFDKLMAENTTDPGSSTYTDGYIFTSGEMVPEFEECVKNTDIDGFGICKSDYGYHVISRLPLTYEAAGYGDIKDNIKQSIISDMVQNKLDEEIKANGIDSELNQEAIMAVG